MAILKHVHWECSGMKGVIDPMAKARGFRAMLFGDMLKMPLQERLREKTTKATFKAFEETQYRKPHSHWVGVGSEIDVRIAEPSTAPSITVLRHRTWSSNGKWSANSIMTQITVPYTWWRIYKKGLAVADGNFVLDILKENEDGTYTVLAGKQGRGLDINPARALLKKDKDGVWHLKWIKEEN